jgi:4-hydroxy-tetrahydrodipicolinate synthase
MRDIHGAIVALLTPMTETEELNEAGLRALVRHVMNGGVHGLYVNGTTGEFYSFDLGQKRRSLEIVMEENAGKLPVIAGAAAITTRMVIKEVKMAESMGADAVTVLTPMFVGPSQEELYLHYKEIAEATGLPILAYNNPSKTAISLAPDTVRRLSAIENIIGVKDSSGDMNLVGEFIRRTPRDRFKVFMGRDNLILAALTYGASGAVAATANIAPSTVAEIYEAFKAGDTKRALDAQNRLTQLRSVFALGTFPGVVKEALNLIGIDAGPSAKPLRGLSEEKRNQLKDVLVDLGLIR